MLRMEETDMGGGSRIPAGDMTQDDEQVVVESSSYPSDSIPRGNQVAGPLKRREPPLDVREKKRTKSLVIGGGSGPTDAGDVHQSQCSSEESELPSSSGQPTEIALANVMFDCRDGSGENEQQFRLLEVDGVKDKISLGHSEAQKDFVEQLCLDLESLRLDVRDGKQTKSLLIRGGSCPTDVGDAHQSQCSSEESELPSSSCQPKETALANVMFDRCEGSRENEQHFRLLEVDGVKHKIFLSHAGVQKNFVEQLCVDLERGGCIAPFFDQRDHSLPKGKDFVSLIKKAAQHCEVAVIVLSKEFLSSKWPMLELVEFHGAQQVGNQRLSMLPLFYMLQVEDLNEKSLEEQWMPKWLKLAKGDKRIDVVKWCDAVRALRKANGFVFGQKGPSEVLYRKDIVQSIFKLSPPDLSYGSSWSMVGFNRICKEVSNRFVRGMSGGPSFLGLYGSMGTGKTTLAKALCDHFRGEYMGKVCLVDLGETVGMSMTCHGGLKEPWRSRWAQLERVKRILEKLCVLDKELLDKVTDVDEAWELMRTHMKREPVFLVIDNLTSESRSWNEAHKYLIAGLHTESKIVITSRSRSNICDVVPDIQLCVRMPSLSVMEAGKLFLRSADPSKSIIGLTSVQQNIVDFCIKQCLIYEDEGDAIFGSSSYHPAALSALGDFFRRYFSNQNMLQWRGDLEENKDWLGVLWKVQSSIRGIFELQLHSLPFEEQLLFLDIAAFTQLSWFYPEESGFVPEDSLCEWLCKVYGVTWQDMERQLQDLERSGMIWFNVDQMGYAYLGVANDIYEKFAKWYVTNHGVELLENAWCVCKPRGSTLNQSSALWSDLVRLRMLSTTLGTTRLLMIQELRNLGVLIIQCCRCPYLTELNLEGLVSLRHLELERLENLEVVKLSGSPDIAKSGGIFESLRYVFLFDLGYLVHGPDVRLCTSLHMYSLRNCPMMTNLNEMECPHLKVLELRELVADQLGKILNLSVLHLEAFNFFGKCDCKISPVAWYHAMRGQCGPGELSLKVVENLLAYISFESVNPSKYVDIRWRKDFFMEFGDGSLHCRWDTAKASDIDFSELENLNFLFDDSEFE